jgi:outer membrane biosynthesis protein TonB
MKPASLISTGVLLVLLGAFTPMYAQEQHDQDAKPEKQEQAKPPKQEAAKPPKQAKTDKQAPEAKPAKQEEAAKPPKTEKQAPAEAKQEQAKPAQQEKQAKTEKQAPQAKPANQEKSQQAQGQWAHNGQKDSRGHEYNESRFGRDHHARFEENGGRSYNGRREYSYGGYWFYAGVYPPWFYQQEVYFIMGADGLWYAVAYDNPSLTFQVNIE